MCSFLLYNFLKHVFTLLLQILIYMAGYYHHFFNSEFTPATKLKAPLTAFNYHGNIIRHVLVPLFQKTKRAFKNS